MFEHVDQLKAELDRHRPLPKHTLKSLHEQQVLAWTYHSNAIEGNTLTIKETKVVLEGITVGGKSIQEHLEAINHKEAISYVEELVSHQNPFSEHIIKSIHQLILKNIAPDHAGSYRQEKVVIAGVQHTPPEPILVPEQMTRLIQWQNAFQGHPVEKAARLHADLVKIHPFIDGNGRTARLLMNFKLLSHGFQPVIIRKEQRLAYYEALDKAHTKNDYQDFIKLIVNETEAALQQVLQLI